MNKSEFGERLVEYRGRCEWSQSELAEIMGVHRNTIATWERGTIPSRGVVLRLADELSLSNAERNNFLKAAGFSDKQWPAKYWNVPYRRNPYFIGRETELQSLRQRLVPGTKTTALVQSISGLGGIGKTQIAIEYAHRYGEYHEAVLWIPADSLEVATAAWLQLATQELGLSEQQEAEQQIAKVKSWLQKRPGWLLIFDNVEDPHEILSTFIPSKHQGSVLITTRRHDAETLAQNEMLPLLAEGDAILFLLRRSKRVAMKESVTEAIADDVALAKDLCQLLDRLPLALDQAGAYIAENGSSFQRYIDLYHLYRPKLLARRNANDQRDPRNKSDHPASVLTTFSLSWQQIQERNPLAGKALQFCAFLAPDQIPEQLVVDGITLPEAESTRDALEIDEALGLLHRYSLVERTEQTLSLHRLVQEVMQDVLSEEERHQWMERAVLATKSVFPESPEFANWSICDRLLPHALQCTNWIELERIETIGAADLLNVIGAYLAELRQYEKVESLLSRARAIYERVLGRKHLSTAKCMNDLGATYRNLGKDKEAETLIRQALTIFKKALGPIDPITAKCLNNLGLLYLLNQGRYAKAKPLLQHALKIRMQTLDPLHLDIAESLNNLGMVHLYLKENTEAESRFRHALHIHEQHPERRHPDTANYWSNLAGVYEHWEEYAEAETMYQRAIAICEQQLGLHPNTALCIGNLASLYNDLCEYGKAEQLYQRAFTIYEERLGFLHHDTMLSVNHLVAFYTRQSKDEEAEVLLLRVLRTCEQQLESSRASSVGMYLSFLADLYMSQEKYMEAEPLYQRALTLFKQNFGLFDVITQVNHRKMIKARYLGDYQKK